MKRSLLLFLALIMSFGCFAAHLSKIMKSWEGSHYGDLIASWGPPQIVYDDGYGGRILIYTKRRQFTAPGKSTTYTTGRATVYDNLIWGSATSTTHYTPAKIYGYTAYRMFWINKKGHIYRWAWRGL